MRRLLALSFVVFAVGCQVLTGDFSVGTAAKDSGASGTDEGADDAAGDRNVVSSADATTDAGGAVDGLPGDQQLISDGDVADDHSGSDSKSPSDGSSESGSVAAGDGGDTRDAGCLSWALGGVGVPAGTVATSSTTSGSYEASNAIDGVLATRWLASDYTGWLALQFPSAQTITGIRMAAYAGPGNLCSGSTCDSTNETYAVTSAGSSATIGSAAVAVSTTGPYMIEPAMPLTPGTYGGLTISVDGGDPNSGLATWVSINEVSLLTTACP